MSLEKTSSRDYIYMQLFVMNINDLDLKFEFPKETIGKTRKWAEQQWLEDVRE